MPRTKTVGQPKGLAHVPLFLATPVNTSFPRRFTTIEAIPTKVSDFPKTTRFKTHARRTVKSQLFMPAFKAGFSKYPFGKLKVGNSFFLPLSVNTKEELHRVRMAVYRAASYHTYHNQLPTCFSLASIFSEKDGQLGLAFFRVM